MRLILITFVMMLSACGTNGSGSYKTISTSQHGSAEKPKLTGSTSLENPSELIEPAAPEEPSELTTPALPEQPSELIEPVVPEEPSQLKAPAMPEQPSELTEPAAPKEPNELTAPTLPEQPSELTEPTVPEEPSELTAPTLPEQPSELTEPVVPEEPSKLTAPAMHKDPNDQTGPAFPELPNEQIKIMAPKAVNSPLSPIKQNQTIPAPPLVYQPSKKQIERLTQQPAKRFEDLPKKQQEKVKESELLPMLAPEKLKHPVESSFEMIFMLATDNDGYYLYAEGAITPSSYERFIKIVNEYKGYGIDLNRLMMHSPGGALGAGLEIGAFIHSNNWITDSSKHMRCYSSCGFIFASGTKKRIQPGTEVGFHRPYIVDQPDTPEFIEATYYKNLEFWQKIGGSRKLYDEFMLNYGRDEMLILNSNTIDKHFTVEKY